MMSNGEKTRRGSGSKIEVRSQESGVRIQISEFDRNFDPWEKHAIIILDRRAPAQPGSFLQFYLLFIRICAIYCGRQTARYYI